MEYYSQNTAFEGDEVKKSTEDIVPKNVDLMGKTQDLSLKNPVSVPVPGKYKLV